MPDTTEAEPDAPGADLAVPESHEALTDLAAGAGLDTIPGRDELAGIAAMAVTLSAASALPDALRNNPNDVFLVLLTGRELGLGPAAALRSLYVVHGQVTLPPKVRAGLVRRQGLGRVWPHVPGTDAKGEPLCHLRCPTPTLPANNASGATWHATRADEDHAIVASFTFTVEDAGRVPDGSGGKTLADKYKKMGYPQRMLSWRALGYLLDDVFPELGAGLYSPDEMGAVVDEDGHAVIDVASTDPLQGMVAPRGHQAPPPEPEPQASDEDIAALHARIYALPAEARPALAEMWKSERDGATPIRPLAELPARQLSRARAVVDAIERRARGGEWGTWPVADPETGEVVPQDPASPQETAETGRSEPETGGGNPEPPLSVEEVSLADAVDAEVGAMNLADVRAALSSRGAGPAGPPDEVRRHLCQLIYAERAPDQPERWEVVSPEDRIAATDAALSAYVATLDRETLVEALALRHAPTEGTDDQLRDALARWLFAEGWEPSDFEGAS